MTFDEKIAHAFDRIRHRGQEHSVKLTRREDGCFVCEAEASGPGYGSASGYVEQTASQALLSWAEHEARRFIPGLDDEDGDSISHGDVVGPLA
jgi:hypothetical protein